MARPSLSPASGGWVDGRRLARSAALLALGLVVLAPAAGGCIRGSLATSTGPNGPTLWSAARKQQAHVGETVRFSFILVDPLRKRALDPYGYADYCIAELGDRRICCEPDMGGRFRFEHRLTGVQADQELEVTATAYRQYGSCDFLPVGETWLRGESPVDDPDRRVCDDSVKLRVYQARVEMKLPAGPSPVDWESGKLELFRDDGTVTPVFIDRPGRPGFAAQGPNQDGGCTVVYLPDGDELNSSGQTRAHLSVHDLAGHPHSAECLVPTP